jgi:pimeloyl-ACP methyl ester carboxylesterase
MRLGGLLLLALLLAPTTAICQTGGQNSGLGVVFMHGKQGNPGQQGVVAFARKIEGAGIAIETPTMCWTQYRLLDKSLPDCLAELEVPIAKLRQRGITRIAVGGQSLGGLGALAFGARNGWLHGVFALAPAPAPGIVNRPPIESSLKQAEDLIAAGRGEETHTFEDTNLGERGNVNFNVRTTAHIFASFFNMHGPANLVLDAEQVQVPLLWVSGTRDPSQLPKEVGYDRVPPGPFNRYARIDADHMETQEAAADLVIEWLRGLKR